MQTFDKKLSIRALEAEHEDIPA
jgi:hypothetical protein